jgi:hypothetical protein
MILRKNELEREKEIRRLVEFAFEEREKDFQERVIQFVFRSGIDPGDPTFLFALTSGFTEAVLYDIPKTLERREAKLNHLVESAEAQYERIKVAADDITVVTRDAVTQIRKLIQVKLPPAAYGTRRGTLGMVLVAGLILGLVLAKPISNLRAIAHCHLTNTCQNKGDK